MVTIHLLSGMHPVGIIFTLSVGQAQFHLPPL